MASGFFEDVAVALEGFLPTELGGFSSRATGANLKLWYCDAHEHYEVQILRGAGKRPALELGFHSEHHIVARNEQVLDHLLSQEKLWRQALGMHVEAGPFLGRQGAVWRRISEVWDDPDLDGADAAAEAADRLDQYVRALEPILRQRR